MRELALTSVLYASYTAGQNNMCLLKSTSAFYIYGINGIFITAGKQIFLLKFAAIKHIFLTLCNQVYHFYVLLGRKCFFVGDRKHIKHILIMCGRIKCFSLFFFAVAVARLNESVTDGKLF